MAHSTPKVPDPWTLVRERSQADWRARALVDEYEDMIMMALMLRPRSTSYAAIDQRAVEYGEMVLSDPTVPPNPQQPVAAAPPEPVLVDRNGMTW